MKVTSATLSEKGLVILILALRSTSVASVIVPRTSRLGGYSLVPLGSIQELVLGLMAQTTMD